MKLLLCISSLNDIQSFLVAHEEERLGSELPFLFSQRMLQHEVDILETGAGVFQTTYKLTKALTRQKYHLALKLSFGNAYKMDHAVGTVLNIVNEKPGDYGMEVDGIWQDFYDLNLLKREEAPHIRGGFVNLTNAYMNVFMPYKKVVGITVNNYAHKVRATLLTEKYKADAETGDGLGFAYTCLFERQNFYHLCVVERNLVTGEADLANARQIMNNTLNELITLL